MKIELLNALDEEFEMCPEAFGGPVNIEEVRKAEDDLKVKLPQDFKTFLLRYGSGAVGEAIVLGLKEADFVATPSFVQQTLIFRKSLPKDYKKFVVIGIDGAGNPVGINSPNTEIVRFDYDTCEEEVIAINFEEYLEKALREEINIHF